jgi:methylated-DNA-protein-cysteine methyltransferase-like protein
MARVKGKRRAGDGRDRREGGVRRSRDDPREGSYARIYAVVRRIPRGRVATYGQVAALAGLPGQARQVGYALHALSEGDRVPWHRVINAQGRVSPRGTPGWDDVQRQFLEAEGVRFDAGRTLLSRYQWQPRVSTPAASRRGEGKRKR